MKKALVVGIDNYPAPNELYGCVNDAVEIASLLQRNGDGSPNFDVRRIVSSEGSVTARVLNEAIKELFQGDCDTALLYFAGHGLMDDETNAGYLVTQDGSEPNWGIPLSSVLELANKAYPRIKSTVIILDSCQSGFAGEVSGLGQGQISVIGSGLTILTACHRKGYAGEVNGHGKFTHLLLDAMGGAACDVLGRVTPAAVYAHVDQTLGAWEQRPVYKANVQTFITLRTVSPRVPREVLQRLSEYFPSDSYIFKLDPSFEPDRGEEASKLSHIAVVEENVRIYRELQLCNRNGLVVPSEHAHMWHSAVFSGGCKLTATGAHFRRLAEKGKL